MTGSRQQNAGSAEKAKQGGEVAHDFSWAEASVWTKRMLSALVNGVKGGKWYALMDKVFAPDTLAAAWTKVRANKVGMAESPRLAFAPNPEIVADDPARESPFEWIWHVNWLIRKSEVADGHGRDHSLPFAAIYADLRQAVGKVVGTRI